MIKQKLINKRIEKKISQEKFADLLGMEQSQYSRRENGIIKISKKEWNDICKFLETNLEEIYEPEDGVYIINNENASGNFGNHNTFNNNSEFVFEMLKKYIKKLEDEIFVLKSNV